MFYSSVKAYGRANETRFMNNLSAINSPKIKIAVIDGAMEDLIARTDFPKATRISLTQLSPFAQNLLNISSGKADVTFAEPGIVSIFLKSNPRALKELAPDMPLRIFGNAYVFKLGEVKFKSMFNTALNEIINNGTVDRLLKKYEPAPGVFLRTALPYCPRSISIQRAR
jgi:ABC-type amino acid transport substrate-binding protein